jgi:hypothetical protein
LLLVIGYWLLVIGYLLLVIGWWLLVIGCWLLVVGYSFNNFKTDVPYHLLCKVLIMPVPIETKSSNQIIPPGINVSIPKPLSSQIIKVIASIMPKIRASNGVRSLGELVMLNIKNLSVSMIT